MLPGQVAKRPEEDGEPAQFLGEEVVAARGGDQVVELAVDGAGLLDELLGRAKRGDVEPPEVGDQRGQPSGVDPPASGPGGGALEEAADLVNLADFPGGDFADDGAAVRDDVDDADAGEGDEGFADRRVADAEAVGQVLGDEVFAGLEAAVEHVGQQRLHDGLAAEAVVAP